MLLQIDELGNVTINVADWDINESFPARTITTDYSTWIAYISRKEVPAGTPITDIKYWKPLTRIQTQLLFDYIKFKEEVDVERALFGKILASYQGMIQDLQSQMQSFIETASGGQAFSTHFGNSDLMGITQKTLTNAIKSIYNALQTITGEPMFEVNTYITPDNIIEDKENPVNIVVNTTFAIIDKVNVWVNNNLVDTKESIESYTYSVNLSQTSIIKVEAIVLGQSYVTTKTINAMSDFYVGAGNAFEDVHNSRWARHYDGDPEGQYPVDVAEGERIIIIIPTEEASKIEQIEMNDINIPMSISVIDTYTVYTSVNVYQAGNYIIDINY